VKLVSISLALGVGTAVACGPFFPATVLDRPDLPQRAHTLAFDLAGLLPTQSVWRAAPADTRELHADRLRWFPPLAEISPPPAAASAQR